ncbi:MAG TPA: Hsp70 family protein, partial [Phycisphaerales bacterium]|nr:Hsp70 family protein [Phycisphaerales bacterium]
VYRRTVTRAEYEAMIRPLVERTLDCCRRALRDDRLERAASDAVILVGGATRTPLVRAAVADFFAREPYTALDPDRVVALGAAVQAAILRGDRQGTLLLDVIPLSLGVETVGGAAAKLIFRNSAVPARAVERFSTSVDGQTSILLRIVQGEREMAADCRTLGEFHLRGIPPMPAGVPQLEVEFLVDANGVLTVRAVERRSGRRASLQVVPNHGLSADEVERMERESYANARDDMTRHRIVDLVANSRLDLKWIGERLERHRAELDPAYAASLDRHAASLRALADAADADWRSVDPNTLHATKEALDRESVRLQEVAIAASLRSDTP